MRFSRVGFSCLFLLLTALVPLLQGCSAGPAPPLTVSPDAIIYGRGGDANTLDPVNAHVGEEVKVITNIFDTLVTYDEKTVDLVPSLATDWEQTADGLSWTFSLRDDVTFHNGDPFNAEAVAFTFNRFLEDDSPYLGEKAADKARPYRGNYTNIDRVEVVDDHKVIFHLKERSAVFLANLAMHSASIVCPGAFKSGDPAEAAREFSTNPVGTGPFKFDGWERDVKLSLSAFKDHWRGAPETKKVIFVSINENANRVQKLRRAEIHIADNLPSKDIKSLQGKPGIELQTQAGLNTAYLTMNMEHPVLGLREVREAIAKAIDKNDLRTLAYDNMAEPAVSLVPPNMWGYSDRLQDYQVSVGGARRILEKASRDHGFELPLKLTLAVTSDPRPYMPQPVRVASYIKDALANIGIEVVVESRAAGPHFEYLRAGKHELGLAGWSSDNCDPDNFLYQLLDQDQIHEDASENLSRYRSDAFHEVVIAAQKEPNRDVRAEFYHQAQKIALEDIPIIPLVHTDVAIAQRTFVTGYYLHPAGIVRLRTAKIDVPQ